MDINEYMILVRDEDKTDQIESFSRDILSDKIILKFKSTSKQYQYNKENIKIFENPEIIDLNGSIAYIGDRPLYNPQKILDFGEKIRIIEYGGDRLIAGADNFQRARVYTHGAALTDFLVHNDSCHFISLLG